MEQEITFGIKGIELLDFSITSPTKPIELNAPFQFNINIEHRFKLETKTIFVIVSVNILAKDTDIKIGNAKINCIYNVTNLDEFVDNGKVIFPNEFIITLNSISLSTCRGILFTLFRGTFLHNAVLPIIDPKGFVESVLPANPVVKGND